MPQKAILFIALHRDPSTYYLDR